MFVNIIRKKGYPVYVEFLDIHTNLKEFLSQFNQFIIVMFMSRFVYKFLLLIFRHVNTELNFIIKAWLKEVFECWLVDA